jgi:hypothetical protein
VQKGKFSAGTLCFDKRLKVLDFPILAMPTIPTFKELNPCLAKSA